MTDEGATRPIIPPLPSRTVTVDDLMLRRQGDGAARRGQWATQHEGPTEATAHLEVGIFELDPGAEPHPVHTHPEEELLVVTAGTGMVHCAGVDRAVGPGAVTYVAPHVPHGIRNTGESVLIFHWIKWRSRGR